tara:strand:- start:10081 stop:10248 length:168 start_codon:yes stop_codon:yes gene_type:complete
LDKEAKKVDMRELKKTEEEEQLKCPMCGRKKAVIKQEDHLYFCKHCQMQFDDRED